MSVLAIQRLFEPVVVQSSLMFWFAILGVAVNGLAVWKVKKGETMNEKVISLHLLEDLLGWCAVLVGSVIIYFTEWYILDPIMALAISMWIFIHGAHNGGKVAHLFLQGKPNNIEEESLISNLKKIQGVLDIHDLHIWSLDGENNISSCHITVEKSKTDNTAIKAKARDIFKDHSIDHVTIEIELNEECCGLKRC